MRSALAWASLLLACSPAVESMPPKPPAPVPPAEKPVPARWAFDDRPSIRAQRDMPGGDLLSVGEGGRRALHHRGGAGPAIESGIVLGDNLWGSAVRADGRFVFIGRSGRTFVTDGPLGDVLEEHDPPSDDVTWTSGGRESVLAMSNQTLFRSIDGGRTWTKIPVAHAGVLRSVVANDKGEGLLLAIPQRLLFTRDDGATWSPIASPGIGAFRVELNAATDVVLRGGSAMARLDAAAAQLVPTKWQPFEFPKKHQPDRDNDAVPVVVGDRTLSFERTWKDDLQSTVLREGPLGGEKTARVVPLLSKCSWTKSGAYGNTVSVICRADEVIVAESRDGGATFTEVARGGSEWASDSPPIQPGPDGFLFVAPKCWNCAPRVRPAGKPSLVDATFPDKLEAIRGIAFDEKKRRVFLLGRTDGSRLRLYSASIDGNAFVREGTLDLEATYTGMFSIVVDEGVPRLFAPGRQLTVVYEGNGKRYLPGFDSIVFAGPRGLAVDPVQAFETADAGRTWTRVRAPNNAYGGSCGSGGCVFGRAERVGWDLPAKAGHHDLELWSDAPPPKARPAEKKPIEPASVPAWNCAAEGAWSKVPMSAPEAIDLSPQVHALGTDVEPTGRATALVVRKDKLETIELLAPAKDDAKHRSVTRAFVDHEGAIAFRYRYEVVEKGDAKSPVEVSAAWVPASTGKLARVTFKADPFRVSTTSALANAGTGLAAGTLFLHPDDSKQLFVLRANAKPEFLPFPEFVSSAFEGLSGPTRRASYAKLGKQTVAARLSSDASLAWLEDGKWTNRQWSLMPLGYEHMELGFAQGKPWIGVAPWGPSSPAWLFPVDGPANDPPDPLIVPLSALNDGTMPACDATDAPSIRASIGFGDARLHPVFVAGVEEGNVILGVRAVSVHAAGKGGACAAVYRAGGPFSNLEPWSAIIPAGDPAHAWLFRPQINPNDFSISGVRARKLKCTAGTAPPPAKLTER